MQTQQVVTQNVTAAEYEMLKTDLASEHFSVVNSGVDSFSAVLAGGLVMLKAVYNRNQQTLTIDGQFSEWHPGMDKDFIKEQILRVHKKEDATDKIQSTPVMTPRDKHTGLPTTPKLPVKDTPPLTPPVSTNVAQSPTPPASVPIVGKPLSSEADLKTAPAGAPSPQDEGNKTAPAVVTPPTVSSTPKS